MTTDLPLRPTRKPFYFPQNSLTYPPQVINNDLLPPPPPPPPPRHRREIMTAPLPQPKLRSDIACVR